MEGEVNFFIIQFAKKGVDKTTWKQRSQSKLFFWVDPGQPI